MVEGGARLPRVEQDPAELALAAHYAPRILFDRHEPFLPQAVGYTIFHTDGYSHSFPRCIGLRPMGRPSAGVAIEYAIWWDWDIQHLYELEHVWIYLDGAGAVVHAEGSWHGDFWAVRASQDGRLPLYDDTHVIVYSQPGKHAFTSTPEPLLIMQEHTRRQCRALTSQGGLLITPIFEQLLAPYKTPEVDTLVNDYLKARAFEPAFVWDKTFDVTSDMLIPWSALEAWIPQRVSWLLKWLRAEVAAPDRTQHRAASEGRGAGR